MSQNDPLLMIPGPTNLPPAVRDALAAPAFYHRGEQMAALIRRCRAGLASLMGLTGDVLILSSSGTGALEASVTNFLSPGDRVVVVQAGKFGERLAEISEVFGASVSRIVGEPGRAVTPDEVAEAVTRHRPRAVLTVHNETSTGVMHPIGGIAAAARAGGAITIVDSVSCLGGVPVEADRRGIDVIAAGSQKCLMLPPGLSFVGVSEHAWKLADSATMPRYYFDLRKARDSQAKGQTPYTPATGLIAALAASLDCIEAEGLERVFARHAAMADATRAALEAAGLRLFAEEGARSQTVTAVHSPVDSVQLVAHLREQHGVLISGGQGDLRGRIFRIGHMGTVTLAEIERTLEALADGLANLGYECDAQEMLAAAREAAQSGDI